MLQPEWNLPPAQLSVTPEEIHIWRASLNGSPLRFTVLLECFQVMSCSVLDGFGLSMTSDALLLDGERYDQFLGAI